MIIHDIKVNQATPDFQIVFSPQDSDVNSNYIILQNLISLISPTLNIVVPTTYNQLVADINANIKSIMPQTPPKEISLFVNCNNKGIIVGGAGGSGLDFSVIKK